MEIAGFRTLQKSTFVISMNKVTTHSMYMLLQPTPWFHEHANALGHLHKTHSWSENKLTSLWSCGLPLKQGYSYGDTYWVCS